MVKNQSMIIDKIKKLLKAKIDEKKIKANIVYDHNVSWRTSYELMQVAKELNE